MKNYLFKLEEIGRAMKAHLALFALLAVFMTSAASRAYAAKIEAYAAYDNNKVLTFYYDDQKSVRSGSSTYALNERTGTDWLTGAAKYSTPAWNEIASQATQVVFDPTFANARPTTCYSWFDGFANLEYITGLENLNTSSVTSMENMFRNCSSLTSLDLRGFETWNVTSMEMMFSGCSNLEVISVTDNDDYWNLSNVKESDKMFDGCNNLGGKFKITYVLQNDDASMPANSPTTYTYNIDFSLSTVKPTCDGNTFLGWYSNAACSDGNEVEVIRAGTDGNVTVYAKWEEKWYHVYWNYNYTGADEPYTTTLVKLNEDITPPAQIPDKAPAGKEFDFWCEDADGSSGSAEGDYGTFDGSSESKTFYAIWKNTTYTLTFVHYGADGNLTTTSFDMEYNSSIESEKNSITPTRTGYTFDSWVDEGGYVFTGNMPPYDLMLYASWTPNEYTVTYNTNGGSPAISSQDFTYDEAANLTAVPDGFAKTGYKFKGWTDVENGTTVKYEDGAEVKNLATGDNAEVTLYAVWAAQYTVKFYGGDMGSTPDQVFTVGEPQKLNKNGFEPSEAGKHFSGWATASGNTTPDYYDGQLISEPLTTEAGATINLFACWGTDDYLITFTDGANTETQYIDAGASMPLRLNTFTKDDLRFVGWTKTSGGTTVEYTDGQLVTFYAATTLYAVWEQEYTITFESNGGTSASPIKYISSECPLALSTPAKDGCDFVGWYESDESQTFTELPAGSTGDKDLYAKWIPEKYEISYNGIDGCKWSSSTTNPNPAQYDVETSTITLANPEKDYYEFLGWTGTGLAMPVKTVKIPKGSTGNREYTANWSPITYTLVYDNGGVQGCVGSMDDMPFTIETGVALTANAYTATGYNFNQWYVGGTTIYFDDKATLTDEQVKTLITSYCDDGNIITLNAKWTINQYTITFNTDGGSTIAPITADFGATITAPVDPTKSGYTFAGWDPEIPATMPVDGLTVKAKWTLITYYLVYDKGDVQGCSGTMEPTPFTIESPEVTLRENVYSAEGCYWRRWAVGGSSRLENNVTFGSDDISVLIDFSDANNKITLTSVWEYAITYELNGGSWPAGVTPYDRYNDVGLTIPTPTKTGYTFLGWTGSNGTTPETSVIIHSGSKGPVNYTANWKINKYEVTFMDGATKLSGPTELEYQADISMPSNPTKTGYTFDGWDNLPSDGKMPAENLTITAKWTPITYTLNYKSIGADLTGGSMDATTFTIKDGVTLRKNAFTSDKSFWAGWHTENFEYKFADEEELSADEVEALISLSDADNQITLFATWYLYFAITYELNGGSLPAGVTNPERYISLYSYTLNSPERDGYTFDGWYQNEEFSGDVVTKIEENSKGTKHFYAKWKPIKYTITIPDHMEFCDAGGNSITATGNLFDCGSTVYFKASDGYGLEPGSSVEAFTTTPNVTVSENSGIYSFTVPASGVTVQATLKKTVTLSVSLDDWIYGESPNTPTVKKNGTQIDNSSVTITYTDSEGNPVTPSSITAAGDYTVTASYAENDVEWYATGFADFTIGKATLYVKADSKSKTYGQADPTLTYTADGFKNGENSSILSGSLARAVGENAGQYEITIGALSAGNNYYFSFTGNNLTIGKATLTVTADAISKTYGQADPTLTYEVTGFKGTDDKTTVLAGNLSRESGEDVGEYEINNNKGSLFVINPNYTIQTVNTNKFTILNGNTVTFHTAYGSVNPEELVHVPNGSTITAPDDGNMTKTGYTFTSKWYTTSNFADGTEWDFSSNTVIGDMDLYAKWSLTEYTITYENCPEDVDNNNQTSYTINDDVTLSLLDDRAGAEFVGWCSDRELNNTISGIAINSGSTGNKTFYAKWNYEYYTITYNLNSGNWPSDVVPVEEHTVDDDFDFPQPVKLGYTFTGWDNLPSDGKMPADNLTLTAKWELTDYTITFETNGGGAIDPMTYTIESETIDLSTIKPEKEGYHFVKWIDNENAEVTQIVKGSFGNVELTALFEAHLFGNWDTTLVATCAVAGLRTHACACGEVETDTIAKLAHTVVVDSAKTATCTVAGLTEGKHCSVCGSVLVAQQTVAKLAHTVVVDSAKTATCTTTGLTEGKHCSVCDSIFVAQQTLPALGHKIVVDSAQNATCTIAGLTEGSHCSVCDSVLVAQQTLPALGHKIETIAGVSSTCTATGLTEGSHCSVCDSIFVAQQTVPALGHKIETVAGVSPTCTADGLTEGSHCSVCGEVIKAQETIPALGHSFTNYIYNNDATTEADGTETAECDREGCNAIDVRTAEGTKLQTSVGTESAEGVVIYAHHNTIVVENATEDIFIYNADGRCVAIRETACHVSIAMQREGIYIVRTGNTTQRVFVK